MNIEGVPRIQRGEKKTKNDSSNVDEYGTMVLRRLLIGSGAHRNRMGQLQGKRRSGE